MVFSFFFFYFSLFTPLSEFRCVGVYIQFDLFMLSKHVNIIYLCFVYYCIVFFSRTNKQRITNINEDVGVVGHDSSYDTIAPALYNVQT